MSRRRWKIL